MADRLAPLTVAVAQPWCTPGDVAANARAHAAAVRAVASRVVVFPELSLTGYEVDTAPPVHPDSDDLVPLIDACAEHRSVAFVGAAVSVDRHMFIATLAVTGTGASVAYRKTRLGAEETHRFHPGPGPVAYVVDGWRLGLGICKDTSVPAHIDATAEVGVDAYLASLVMHSYEADEQDARAARIAHKMHVPVAFASFAGPTGSGYHPTAGRSGIWTRYGTAIAQAGPQPGQTASATLHH